MTVTIQIGNSDNKLTQLEWSNFIDAVDKGIAMFNGSLHFSGGSCTSKPWQNWCWVFDFGNDPMVVQSFQKQLAELRAKYKQDSLAWTDGATVFV